MSLALNILNRKTKKSSFVEWIDLDAYWLTQVWQMSLLQSTNDRSCSLALGSLGFHLECFQIGQLFPIESQNVNVFSESTSESEFHRGMVSIFQSLAFASSKRRGEEANYVRREQKKVEARRPSCNTCQNMYRIKSIGQSQPSVKLNQLPSKFSYHYITWYLNLDNWLHYINLHPKNSKKYINLKRKRSHKI